jgi:hypothetical protein
MNFFDTFLGIGRTNDAVNNCPTNRVEALALMDYYDVDRAFVYHTVARDSDPDQGNNTLEELGGPRLYPVYAFDPAYVIIDTVENFLSSSLAKGSRAVMINPLMRRIRLDRSPRIKQLAALLESRRIPLFLIYWQTNAEQDLIDWYELSDFCRLYPRLPILVWEWRTRSNRTMFDVLAETKNLKVSISSLWQARSIEQITNSYGPDRLVFSMGLPNLDPGSFQACLRYAKISEDEKRMIASGSLESILAEADYE